MGADTGEDFDPRVLPDPAQSFAGVDVGFYFNPRVKTRNSYYSLFCVKIINI
jgi:hypothetical protein